MAKPKEGEVDVFSLEDIPGLGPVSIKKLNENEVFTKMDMMIRQWIEIADITGVDRDKVAGMIEYCKDQLQKHEEIWPTEMTADKLLDKRTQEINKVKLLATNINEVLEGGFEERCITELAGEFHSGKTQIALSVALRSLLPVEEGGLMKDKENPNRVVWIDTEKTFRPQRLVEMALKSKQAKDDEQVKEILSRFHIQTPLSPSHLIKMLERISSMVREWNFKVLVIDSGAALFRQEMQDLGNTGRKFRLMNTMVRLLGNIAELHNVCVIYVNQVYNKVDGFGDPLVRYGGNVVGHAMTYRVTVRKSGKKWVFTTTDFPHIEEQDVEFMITDKGIQDKTK